MSKARPANTAERRMWAAIIDLGCIVGLSTHCHGRLTIHHCGTGAGGRKDHTKVICLCEGHHQGTEGIDGKQNHTKKSWQEKYGTEIGLMVKTQELLDKAKVPKCERCYGRGVCVIKPHGALFVKKVCPLCNGAGNQQEKTNV